MPTLRAVTTVMMPDGSQFGWIVINADLRPLLEAIGREAANGLRLSIANSEGSYLLHPEASWRFGHDLGREYNLLRPTPSELARRRGLWQVFNGSYEFSPGQPRRFHVQADTDGRAALADLRGASREAVLASALTVAACLFLLVMLARLVTRRLRRVADALGLFGTGGPVVPLPEEPADEIGLLAAAFNRMSEKIADQLSTLQEARREADEASRAKDDFLAVMSHEIRTPLNSVTGMLYLLERNRPAPHQEPILRSLNAAAGQLTSLLNEALDWSKIRAGGLVCDPAPFDLAKLLTDLELTHRPLAAQKGLHWTLDVSADFPPAVTADRLRLSQILHNLLSNAVKFTSEGHIRLAVVWKENELICRVEDSGIGIRESDIGRIFSPFDQAHGEIGRRFGGTGLGLSISRSLAGLMGGQLTAESRPGEGSCFILTIPCPASAIGPVPSEPDLPAAVPAGLHVLGVEDSSSGREVLAAFLEAAGVTFRFAGTGADALKTLLESGPFDAALLDLQLPDMNGIELAGKIHTGHPGLPLIAVTAQTGETTRAACESAGFSGFLTKPLDPVRLQEALARIRTPGGTGPVPSGWPGPPQSAPSPLLTDLFAHEPDRLKRVLHTLAGEFRSATAELEAASAARDPTRARRLRHKLHSAIAGLALTPLDQSFTVLLVPDWTATPNTLRLLREAADHCAAGAAALP